MQDNDNGGSHKSKQQAGQNNSELLNPRRECNWSISSLCRTDAYQSNRRVALHMATTLGGAPAHLACPALQEHHDFPHMLRPHQLVLQDFQNRQAHPKDDLGALEEQGVPHPGRSLRQRGTQFEFALCRAQFL